jgi:hypothetical protein
VDVEYNALRSRLSRLNNAPYTLQPAEAYLTAVFLRGCTHRIQLAAIRLGMLPVLTSLLLDTRSRLLSNACYACGFLVRNCPENQAAARAAGVIPLLVHVAKNDMEHTQSRALSALAYATADCPDSAALARSCGAVPLVLDYIKRPGATWTLKVACSAVVTALGGADPVSRQLFVESTLLEAFADMMFVCKQRPVHGRVKDAMAALGQHWSLLDPRVVAVEVEVEAPWVNPDALDDTFMPSAFHVEPGGHADTDDDEDGGLAGPSGGAGAPAGAGSGGAGAGFGAGGLMGYDVRAKAHLEVSQLHDEPTLRLSCAVQGRGEGDVPAMGVGACCG